MTNVSGTIEVTQEFLLLLKKSVSPRIINISGEVSSLSENSNDSVKSFF